jgi:hypothetical protein
MVVKTSYIPDAIVKILSLGCLPLTINDGEIFVEANDCPEHVEPQKLAGREISSTSPIEVKFSLPQKLMNPVGIREPVVKMVCQFSYTYDGKHCEYRNEKIYKRGRFENVS